MTALYRCDGCDGVMGEDAPRIALELVNEPEKPVDPNEEDDSLMFAEIRLAAFGFAGDHHFCQMSCLSAWAMGRAIDERTSA